MVAVRTGISTRKNHANNTDSGESYDNDDTNQEQVSYERL